MVILVFKKKRYWETAVLPPQLTPDTEISADGQVLTLQNYENINEDGVRQTIKENLFRLVELKEGTRLHCRWMDEEEGFYNPCTVVKLEENNEITVKYEDDGLSTCPPTGNIKIADKVIADCSVDLEENLSKVLPEVAKFFQEEKLKAEQKAKEEEEARIAAEKKKAEDAKNAAIAAQKQAVKKAEEEARAKIENQPSKRVVAAILALTLGMFGAHKFYLGYKNAGYLQIASNCLGLGYIIGFYEFFVYIGMSDKEFVKTYQINEKHWF